LIKEEPSDVEVAVVDIFAFSTDTNTERGKNAETIAQRN